MRFSATSNSNMSLRSGHGATFTKLGQLNVGTTAYGDEIWVAPAGVSGSQPGDIWLHVRMNGTATIDAWMAIIHMGVRYCVLVDNGITPPVDDVVRVIKATVMYESSDGSIHEKECFPDESSS